MRPFVYLLGACCLISSASHLHLLHAELLGSVVIAGNSYFAVLVSRLPCLCCVQQKRKTAAAAAAVFVCVWPAFHVVSMRHRPLFCAGYSSSGSLRINCLPGASMHILIHLHRRDLFHRPSLRKCCCNNGLLVVGMILKFRRDAFCFSSPLPTAVSRNHATNLSYYSEFVTHIFVEPAMHVTH